FYLIDLDSVTLHRPLSWPQSRENLTVLNRWFTVRAHRTDRLRFWRAYVAARRRGRGISALASADFAAAALEFEQRTWKSHLEFWKRRDRRGLRSNRYYRRLRTSTIVGYAVTELDAKALGDLCQDPDGPFKRPGARMLKDSRSATVTEMEMQVNGQPRKVI